MNSDVLIAASRYEGNGMFPDIETALRFGLRHGAQALFRDTLGRLQATGGRSEALTPDEKTAQAGLILRRLETLTSLDQALLTLRYSLRQRPCNCRRACCSGWAVDAGWDRARVYLVEASMEAFSGRIIHYRLRDGLVRKWAGQKINVGELADACGVHRQTVGIHGKVMKDWLGGKARLAVARAEGLLRGEVPMLAVSEATTS